MRKVLFLLSCLAITLFAGPKAQWIAFNESSSSGNGETRYFRYEFDIPDKEIQSAVVCFLFGGSGTFFYVNGSSAEGKGTPADMYEGRTSTQPKKQFEVKTLLLPGKKNAVGTNVANSSSSQCGFIAHLLITFKDGTTQEVFSDTNWLASKAPGSTDYHDFAKAGFTGGTWSKAKSLGDCTSSQWENYDMLPLYAGDDAATEIARRNGESKWKEMVQERLASAPREEAKIIYQHGGAFFQIGENEQGEPNIYRPVLYNCNDAWKSINSQPFREQVRNFVESDIKLITVSFEAKDFWTGPGKYDYDVVDNALRDFYELTCIDENGFSEEGFKTRFLVSLNFSHGPTWWNSAYPEETAKYARVDVKTSRGSTIDTFPNNESGDCIGNYPIHSYASEQWINDSTTTISKFVEHIEKSIYGKHVFGYRFGEGVYSEWHYFGMSGAMPDVSAPMVKFFRSFLREKYGDDVARLRAAWNQPKATFENALIPPVEIRLKYLGNSLRDPRNAWSIDYLECLAFAQKSLLMAMNKAAKDACQNRCLVGNYCGYFYGMGYSAEAWHVLNDEILASEYVDFQIAPCCYASEFRSVGGSQLARGLSGTYRLHNKACIMEADSRTHLANKGSKFANTVQESLATLSRDLAQAAGYGCAYWYYDFGNVWYNCPEIFDFFHKIADVYNAITDFNSTAEVAIIGDFESATYHAIQDYSGGLPTYVATSNQTLELNKAGVVFDSYSFADIDNPALQKYKMFIFPQLFYMTPEKQAKLDAIKKSGKTLVFLNAAGWLTPDGPSDDSVRQTIGMDVEVKEDAADLETRLIDGDNRGTTMSNSGTVYPVLNVTDANATVLGTVTLKKERTKASSYAVKEDVDGEGWTSYVCGAPFITAAEIRRIATAAGVHFFCDSTSGIVYANSSMISFHTGAPGTYTLNAKSPVKWKMVYPAQEPSFSATRQASHTFTADKADTYIFVIEP
ncbi:MAG: hypothetical protein MJ202_04230 [Lentisphaeria bacterium]|nr:hypothetical protein [Lentisphaeria bacterium]